MAAPVAVCEVLYDSKDALSALAKTPFVGRHVEIERLRRRLARAKAGRSGSLILLAGEPGIGKTRTAEELAEEARRDGARILWGRCFEGDTTLPYGPFAEAFTRYAKEADAAELQADLGPYGSALAKIAPVTGQRVPDLPPLMDLNPDEERWRLFDAVVQLLGNIAARAPLLLVLDDLHWADGGTIALVRHVARSLAQTRMVVLGLYRDVELDRTHPLGESLAALRREGDCERIVLHGLDVDEVGELLGAMAAHDVPPALVDAINRETDGNPFFVREIVLHLIEDGKVYREAGRWTSHLSIEALGIPEGVRQVIGRRLSRLSEPANRLLGAAAGTSGAFCFDVAWRVAGLAEASALDGLDEALDAQLIFHRTVDV
jgi:predicted ATPase